MSFSRNLLKAFVCIAIFLFCSSPVFSQLTSIDQIKDLSAEDWAYGAVKRLVEKYGVKGYPDRTFKGKKYADRFELAAALDQVAIVMGDQIAELGVRKADREDVKQIVALQREFETELATFRLRAAAIERKNLEQDAAIQKNSVRIKKFERVRTSRDLTTLIQSDQGHGVQDGIGYVFRVRNDTEVTYLRDNPERLLGEGKVFFRLTGAAGRAGPLANTFPQGTVLNLFNDLGTDSSSFNEDTRNLGGVFNTRASVYVEQAYLSQDIHGFKGGKFNLTGGLVDITNYFDTNAVANSECTQFTNLAFVNHRDFANANAFINPAGVFQWDQPLIPYKLNLSLKAAIMAEDNMKMDGAFTALYEAGLQYFIKNKEGNIRFGGFNGYINGSDRIYMPQRPGSANGYGFYLSADQQLYKNTRVFARYGLSNTARGRQTLNNTQQALSFGAEFNVGDFINKRPNDVIGIAFAFATPISNPLNNPLSLNNRSEKVIEAYYKAQLTEALSIGPHFQAIYSPGGYSRPLLTVIGLRTYLTF